MRFLLIFAVLGLAGCHSLGPASVPRDRADYSQSVGDSWKSQMLLNIVKLRYADVPVFVEVGQIVAGYSLETSVNAGGQFNDGSLLGNSTTLGASGKFTNRPTITYLPLTGGKFQQELLTPIPPAAIFKAIQSGIPADSLLWLGVSSINGVRNARSGPHGGAAADPRFERVAALLREAQTSGALGIRVVTRDNGSATLLTIRNRAAEPESVTGLVELRGLLNLSEGVEEFPLVLGDVQRGSGEVAVQTRTLLGILQALAQRITVPERDLSEGRAGPGIAAEQDLGRLHFRVSSSRSQPVDAAVAVPYRDGWYYIDDRDLATKRAFSMIMMLFTLANAGSEAAMPLLTIPTN